MSISRKTAVSLADVARAAGVATSTASRALSLPDMVSPATRERVLAAAAELGYRPNAVARNLRLGRGRTILAVLPEDKKSGISTILSDLLAGAHRRTQQEGHVLSIATLGHTAMSHLNAVSLAHGSDVAGVLLAAALPPSGEGRSLLDAGVPVVSLTRDLTELGISSVVTSDRDSFSALVDRLAGLGHRDFGFLHGPASSYHSAEREAGVRAGLDRHFGRGWPLMRMETDYTVESGERAAQQFLAAAERPTAVMSWADEVALGFQSAVRRAGVSIPGELSFASFDGLKALDYTVPRISTFDQQTAELGEMAAALLFGEIAAPREGPARLLRHPAVFREGESIARACRPARPG